MIHMHSTFHVRSSHLPIRKRSGRCGGGGGGTGATGGRASGRTAAWREEGEGGTGAMASGRAAVGRWE